MISYHILFFILLEFAIKAGNNQTGVKKCIQFSNLSRQLWIKIPAQELFFEWKEAIERVMLTPPGKTNIFAQING